MGCQKRAGGDEAGVHVPAGCRGSHKERSAVSCPISLAMLPLIELAFKYARSSAAICPIPLGRLPVNELVRAFLPEKEKGATQQTAGGEPANVGRLGIGRSLWLSQENETRQLPEFARDTPTVAIRVEGALHARAPRERAARRRAHARPAACDTA